MVSSPMHIVPRLIYMFADGKVMHGNRSYASAKVGGRVS